MSPFVSPESKSVYSQASLLLSVLVRSGTGFDDDTSAALKAANALVDRRLQEWDSDTPHSSPFVVV